MIKNLLEDYNNYIKHGYELFDNLSETEQLMAITELNNSEIHETIKFLRGRAQKLLEDLRNYETLLIKKRFDGK